MAPGPREVAAGLEGYLSYASRVQFLMIEIEKMPLAALVKHHASRIDSDPLLTFVDFDADGNKAVQYRDYGSLWARGQALAQSLQAEGMKPGDRLALMMQNHPEYVDAMVACAILGVVYVPIDPRTRGKKLEYMLEFVECKGVIAGEYCQAALAEVSHDTKAVEWIWFVGQPASRERFAQRVSLMSELVQEFQSELPILGSQLDMPMQLLFTSGTTGDPKAIMGSYGRYAALCSMRPKIFGITQSDRMYTGLSLTHANALCISLGASLYAGIPLVISQRFTKSKMWQVIREHQCTTLNLLGGMFTAVHAEPETSEDGNNPLRLVIGAGMPKQLWKDFERRFDVKILEFYGAAEGGNIVNAPGVGPVGSIGKPSPQFVATIVDEEGRECPPNVPGEIVIGNTDGSPVVVEYYKNPEASAKKTEGGLLRMGDVGYRDEEGWFYFMHRKGGGIRRNGDFISTGYIEKELGEHPDVIDVFVYGVPSANGAAGEKEVVAAVVLTDPASFRLAALLDHCKARLEKNHIPSYLQLVDGIPKTASEKPLERVLLQEFDVSAANVIPFLH